MNILLADSHRDLLQSYERLLTMKGHQVTTAFDGTQVVQLTAERRFDLVILSFEVVDPIADHADLIMTSNIGAEKIGRGGGAVGFSAGSPDAGTERQREML